MIIGFIGGGNMAEALIKGLTVGKNRDILFYDPSEQRIQHLMKTYGAGYVGDNSEVVKRSDIIIIAVKPQIIDEVLDEITQVTSDNKLFVSIAAGIRLSYLCDRLKTPKVIRVMPNTPALVQAGMSVISPSEAITAEELFSVREIFRTLGEVYVTTEDKMDAVTALSGSGPGFIAYFIECMIEAGQAIGLTLEEASTLSIQTFIGSAEMLKSGMSPTALREMVTSPNGTTFAGLTVLREKGFQEILIQTLKRAKQRAEELGIVSSKGS